MPLHASLWSSPLPTFYNRITVSPSVEGKSLHQHLGFYLLPPIEEDGINIIPLPTLSFFTSLFFLVFFLSIFKHVYVSSSLKPSIVSSTLSPSSVCFSVTAKHLELWLLSLLLLYCPFIPQHTILWWICAADVEDDFFLNSGDTLLSLSLMNSWKH